MILTNKYKIPQVVLNAINYSWYSGNEVEKDVSVTELLGSVRQIELFRRHKDTLVQDASKEIFSMLGSAMHLFMEKGNENNSKYIQELRLTTRINGCVISGSPDGIMVDDEVNSIAIDENCIYDYKVTTMWNIANFNNTMNDTKDKWILQTNIYKYMIDKMIDDIENDWNVHDENKWVNNSYDVLRSLGLDKLRKIKEIKTIKIIYIIRDHKRETDKNKKIYDFINGIKNSEETVDALWKKCPIGELDIELLDRDLVEKYIINKTNQILACRNVPDDELPFCKDKEMWKRNNNLQAWRETNKTPSKTYYSTAKGISGVHAQNRKYATGKSSADKNRLMKLAKIPAVYGKCEDWCPQKAVCNQYLENKNNEKGLELIAETVIIDRKVKGLSCRFCGEKKITRLGERAYGKEKIVDLCCSCGQEQ